MIQEYDMFTYKLIGAKKRDLFTHKLYREAVLTITFNVLQQQTHRVGKDCTALRVHVPKSYILWLQITKNTKGLPQGQSIYHLDTWTPRAGFAVHSIVALGTCTPFGSIQADTTGDTQIGKTSREIDDTDLIKLPLRQRTND